MIFFNRSNPLHSFEGYTIVIAIGLGFFYKDQVITFADKHQGLTGTFAVECFRAFTGAFFTHLAETRRLDADERHQELQSALQGSELSLQEAAAAEQHMKWVVAGESYVHAATTLRSARVESTEPKKRMYAANVQAARCYFLGAQLHQAHNCLMQPGTLEHTVHPSQYYALRGLVRLGLNNTVEAANDFGFSLQSNAQQNNLTLLFYYAKANYALILKAFALLASERTVHHISIEMDDLTFGPTLMAYASALQHLDQPSKAFAIYEAIYCNWGLFKPGTFSKTAVVDAMSVTLEKIATNSKYQPIAIQVDRERHMQWVNRGTEVELNQANLAEKKRLCSEAKQIVTELMPQSRVLQ